MRILKIIFYAIWLFVLTVFQPTLIQWIGIFGISPNIFLVFVVAASFLQGKEEGAVCGFIFGLAFDMMTGRMVGLSAIVFMYIALAAGVFKERFYNGSGSVSVAVLTAAASGVYGFVYYIAYYMVWGDISLALALLRVIMPEVLYTTVTGFILFVPIRKSFSIFGRRRMMY